MRQSHSILSNYLSVEKFDIILGQFTFLQMIEKVSKLWVFVKAVADF